MASDTGLRTRFKRTLGKTTIKGFPWRVFYRYILVQSLIAIFGLALAGVGARYFFKRQFLGQVRSQLQDTLYHISVELPSHPGEGWCRARAQGTELRFALFHRDGKLICESHPGSAHPEELWNSPEILAARRGRFGESVRYDGQLREPVFYGASQLGIEAYVVQVAIPLTRLTQTMSLFNATLVFSLLLVAAVLVGMAVWSARRLVFPLGRLLLKTQAVLDNAQDAAPLSKEEFTEEGFDEWIELESNIETMRKDLFAKAQSLSMEQVELDTIMGAISDAILAVDPTGSPLFFNSRFEILFGGEGLRKRFVKLWGIFREPDILGAFTSALKEGKVASTKAIPLEQKEGLRSYFSLSVSPLRKQDGTIYGAVGIFHDVTQLKSAEQMRIDFVANVSHELRTPLTAIKGYVDTLIEDVKHQKPVDATFLSIISRNSDRLLNLMNDLLDLSAIESDDVLQKDLVDTRDLTKKVFNQLEPKIQAKRQIFQGTFEASTVFADPHRVEQVLINLLDNATKYTPEAGHIEVAWLTEGNDVLLRVRNDGPAIPLEHQNRLFERFYRVDKARSREQGGTGLGLAIVKHIMQNHEGTVAVESSIGKGTAFLCRFPMLAKA